MSMSMKVDNKFYDFLTSVEGKYKQVYLDSGGESTIGIGHLLTLSERRSGKIIIGKTTVEYRHGLTEQQVMDLCQQDIRDVVNVINQSVIVTLSQNQFSALVSFVFNVGDEGFRRSTLLRLLNQGRFIDIPTQLRRWKYDNGQVIQGLINRREKEIQLWLS